MMPDVAKTIEEDVRDVYGPTVVPDWQRFAAYVTNRRSQMGLTQEQVAAMGGPSTATMRLIEAGGQTNYRSHTLYSLDRALGWAPGSHLGVLAGQEPHTLIPAEEFREKIASSAEAANGVVYRRRDETALRDAVRELRRGAEQGARAFQTIQQAAAVIADELDAGDE